MENRYDAIVIGTGCGGSGTAALLSSMGAKVLLLERSRDIGGRTATYEKEGFKLDHGHIVMRSHKGPHGEVLRLAGCPDLIPKFSTIGDWGVKVLIGDKYLDIFPNIMKHVTSLKGIRQTLSFGLGPKDYLALARMVATELRSSERYIRKHFDQMDLASYIAQFTDNFYIRTYYSGVAVVAYGAVASQTCAGEHVRVHRGAYSDHGAIGYPVNGEGISAIPKSFVRAAVRLGGVIQTSAPVEGIIIEGGRAKGVRVGGENIFADIVVSNAGIRETVNKLAGPEHFDPAYVKRINSLKYSYAGLSIKYALDKPISRYGWCSYIPDNMERINAQMSEGGMPDALPFMAVVGSNIDPTLAPPGKQSISVLSGGPIVEGVNMDWKKVISVLKTQVKQWFPEIEEHTLFCDIALPAAIAKSTGRTFGDAIGVAQTIDQVGTFRPSKVSPVQNLFYVGADVGRGQMASELASQSAIALYNHLKKTGWKPA